MDNTQWWPISDDDLQREIDQAVTQMTPEPLNLRNAIQVPPQKWALHP